MPAMRCPLMGIMWVIFVKLIIDGFGIGVLLLVG